MESRGSSSREITDDAIAFVDAHRDRKFFLWIHYYDPHLSYETHPEVPPFGPSRVDGYDGEIRFTDLHLGRLIAHLRAAGCGIARRSSSPAITAKVSANTASPSTASISTRRRRRSRSSCASPASRRAGCARPSGTSTSRRRCSTSARGTAEPAFIGRSLVADVAGPPAADTDTRAVFQEVTSERGKKRALVDDDAAPHLECGAQRHDGVLRPHARPGRDPRHLAAARRETAGDGSCAGAGARAQAPGRRAGAAAAEPPRSSTGGDAARAARRRRRRIRWRRGSGTPSACAATIWRRDACARGRHVEVDRITSRAQARSPAGWRLFFHLEGPGGYPQPGPRAGRRADAARALAAGPADPRSPAHPDSRRVRRAAATRSTSAPSGAPAMRDAPRSGGPAATPPDRLRLLTFAARSQ